jgi:serine/threonine protein kinase
MDPQSSLPLRRVKPFHFSSLQDTTSAPSVTTKPQRLRQLLRINFKDPKEDYTFVQELRSNQGTLVCHKKNHLHPAIIRESFSLMLLQIIELLAYVQHPNIANILDVYFYNSQLGIVSKYLDVSLLDLEFKELALEE